MNAHARPGSPVLFGILSLVGAGGVAAADSANEAAWTGHVSYVAGYKALESGWEPVDGQAEFGIVDADFQPPHWPLSLCTQFLLTYAGDVPAVPNVRGDYSGVWEFNLGVRKVWNPGATWQPFLGGGLSILGASASTFENTSYGGFQNYEESDTTAGAWVGGGLYWNFATHWHVGAEVQYSWGELNFFGTRLNAGGVHALAMFGYHW
jgi:hypothetical protein